MVYPTGPTDPNVRNIVKLLRKESVKNNAPIWKAVAKKIMRPSRQRAVVNISKINRYTKENDLVIIPGKVLASGDLEHKVTVAALSFSEEARNKLEQAGCTILPIEDFINQNPKGTNVKILT